MKIYKASDYGVAPGKFCEKELESLLESVDKTDDEKVIEFESGEYLIDAVNLKKRMLYITNTAGDKEYSKDETPHLSRTPFYFDGLKNVTVEGNGARFVIHGMATNMAVENCENLKIKDLEIAVDNPHMHELKVVGKGLFHVDMELDKDTKYEIDGKKMYFVGHDYRIDYQYRAPLSWWNGYITPKNPDKVVRTRNPLWNSVGVKELAPHKIRATVPFSVKFKKGDKYYIFDSRRQYVGIFVNKSRDIVLEKIKQSFSYSLALVCQDTENITVDSVEFAPEKESGRLMSSVADFIQICMCRGKATVVNSYFDGAGDDCLNVHGFHYKISKIDGNKITVKYIHPQSHGFNPLRAGDEIAYINPKTMLECGRAKIEKSEMLSETEILLTLDDASGAVSGNVVEDLNACPDLYFANNTYTRIITRGLLITTRGKVVVENNKFISNSMAGILLSDDAKSWYESGMCRDVTIRNNEFCYCGGNGVMIVPENGSHEGAVHKNIKIIGNTFKKCDDVCIRIKSSSDIEIKDNKIGKCPEKLKTSNVENLTKDF